MTRKDYIRLAEALRTAHKDACERKPKDPNNPNSYLNGHRDGAIVGISDAVREIADALQRDNSRFNREHFLAVVRGEKDLRSRPARNGGAS